MLMGARLYNDTNINRRLVNKGKRHFDPNNELGAVENINIH